MKCSKCPAWGIDNLGFRGCLIRNSILGDIYCNYHCNMHNKIILEDIKNVKQNEPRNKFYKWLHDKRQ